MRSIVVPVLGACLGFAACGGDSAKNNGGGRFDNEVLVQSATGGEVYSADGVFRIELDAFSLSSDATVRVDKVDDSFAAEGRGTAFYRVTTTPSVGLSAPVWVFIRVPEALRDAAESMDVTVARRDSDAKFFEDIRMPSYDGISHEMDAGMRQLGDFTLLLAEPFFECTCDVGPGCSSGCQWCDLDCDNAATCASGEWACGVGLCLPASYECDGTVDCLDGSDEDTQCEPVGCTSSQFTCDNGDCIPLSWECDEASDCDDGSDEGSQCDPVACTTSQFTCDDGECIPESWECDTISDCDDGSDEEGCGTTVIAADAYEPDDSFVTAQTIAPAVAQAHSFHVGTDHDYVTFTVSSAQTIVLETSGADTSGDTEIYLYDAAHTELGYDDEGGSGSYSRLSASVAAGTYYALVDSWGEQPLASYSLSLAATP
jgi:hypothetical protein